MVKIDYQETFFQSKRVNRYDELFDKLIEKNLVYPCFESNEELEIKKKLQLKLVNRQFMIVNLNYQEN